MTRKYFTGFELGTTVSGPDGLPTNTTGFSVQSTTKRSGAFALQVTTSGAGTSNEWQAGTAFVGSNFSSGTTPRSFFFGFYKAGNPPTAAARIADFDGTAAFLWLRLNTDGSLSLMTGASTVVATSSALSSSAWHKIELRLGTEASSIRSVNWLVNGASVHNASTTMGSAGGTTAHVVIYTPNTSTGSFTYYVDDVVIDEDASTAQSIVDAKVLLMLPTADSQRGSWTGGAGGTTNLFDALNNTPPIGTASETNLTQIESADNSGDNSTDEYRADLGTYTAAGVETFKAAFAFCYHGEDVSTGAKTGSFDFFSNPAGGTPQTFDFGNNLGALGTWVNGWSLAATPLYEGSVTNGSSALLVVRKTDSGTRVASVAFMGLYVESTPAGGSTGSLAATEVGADTAALAGDVLVSGTVAATESASDAAAIAGDVLISGSLAADESGADIAAITGTALAVATGALDVTEDGADAAVLSGLVLVRGTLAATESGADTAELAGFVLVHGSIAAVESGADSAALNGTVLVQGQIDATEAGADAADLAGRVLVQGSLDAAETGADTAALSGSQVASGALDATEVGDDTAALSGAVLVEGALAADEFGADTAALSGAVLVQAVVDATEVGDDTAAFTGNVPVSGALDATEVGADTAAMSAAQTSAGTLEAAEQGDDEAAFSGSVLVQGLLAATEAGSDAAELVGSVLVLGSLDAAETSGDTASLAGDVLVSGSFATAEVGEDTAAIVGTALGVTNGTLAATEEGNDTAEFSGSVPVRGTLAATDAADAAELVGAVLVAGTVAATESGFDAAALAGDIIVQGSFSAVEGGEDTAAIFGPTASLSPYHAALLEALARLHGLIDPLTVSQNQRTDGTVVQTVSQVGATVTITTVTAPSGDPGPSSLTVEQASWLEGLARLHGLLAPLSVTASSRGDGTVQQLISTAGGTTTVTMQ